MAYHVVGNIRANVSAKTAASIFKVEGEAEWWKLILGVELEQVDLTRLVFYGEDSKKHSDIGKWEKDVINKTINVNK